MKNSIKAIGVKHSQRISKQCFIPETKRDQLANQYIEASKKLFELLSADNSIKPCNRINNWRAKCSVLTLILLWKFVEWSYQQIKPDESRQRSSWGPITRPFQQYGELFINGEQQMSTLAVGTTKLLKPRETTRSWGLHQEDPSWLFLQRQWTNNGEATSSIRNTFEYIPYYHGRSAVTAQNLMVLISPQLARPNGRWNHERPPNQKPYFTTANRILHEWTGIEGLSVTGVTQPSLKVRIGEGTQYLSSLYPAKDMGVHLPWLQETKLKLCPNKVSKIISEWAVSVYNHLVKQTQLPPTRYKPVKNEHEDQRSQIIRRKICTKALH